MDKAKAIKSLYSQRERFVLIGLTGRTGSGCSTVSEILSKDNINELDLRAYKTCDYNSSDERKYSVVYRFMQGENRWKKFTIIEASSIIFSFILQETYEKLFLFLDIMSQDGDIKDLDNLKRKIVECLRENPLGDEEVEGVKNEVVDKKVVELLKNINKSKSEAELKK